MVRAAPRLDEISVRRLRNLSRGEVGILVFDAARWKQEGTGICVAAVVGARARRLRNVDCGFALDRHARRRACASEGSRRLSSGSRFASGSRRSRLAAGGAGQDRRRTGSRSGPSGVHDRRQGPGHEVTLSARNGWRGRSSVVKEPDSTATQGEDINFAPEFALNS